MEMSPPSEDSQDVPRLLQNPKVLLPRSKEFATCPNTQPDETNPHATLFLYDPF
jgi:hypothetical protein